MRVRIAAKGLVALVIACSSRAAAAESFDDDWSPEESPIQLYGDGGYQLSLELGRAPTPRPAAAPPEIVALRRSRPRRDAAPGSGAFRKRKSRFSAGQTASFSPRMTPLPNAWAIKARNKEAARVVVRLESDPLQQVASRAPGVSFKLIDEIDVGVSSLLGRTMGIEPQATFSLRRGDFRPSLNAGVPFFFFSETTRVGVAGAAGLEWEPIRRFAFYAQVGGVRYMSVPTGYAKSMFLPTAGVVGRL